MILMAASERFYKAISGLRPDRIPSFPKIWLDLGAILTGLDCIGPLDPLSFMNNTPDQSDLVPLLWTSSKLM